MATSSGYATGARPLPADGDPELPHMKDNKHPVVLGNKCTVQKQYIDKVEVAVHWTEVGGMVSDKVYYEVAFTNTSQANVKGFLFIDQDSLSGFRKLAKDEGDVYMFEVNTTFQYGQLDKHGENRFLVFHDPDLIRIPQHRFLLAAWLRYGHMAFHHVGKVPQGAKAVGLAVDTLTRKLGEQLKPF